MGIGRRYRRAMGFRYYRGGGPWRWDAKTILALVFVAIVMILVMFAHFFIWGLGILGFLLK